MKVTWLNACQEKNDVAFHYTVRRLFGYHLLWPMLWITGTAII